MGFFNKISNCMIVDTLKQLPDRGDSKMFGTNVSQSDALAISQTPMRPGSLNVTCKCSTMSPGNPFILESKGQRSRVTERLCRSSDGMQYCCSGCVHKPHGVFPAAVSLAQAMLAVPGFSYVTSGGRMFDTQLLYFRMEISCNAPLFVC